MSENKRNQMSEKTEDELADIGCLASCEMECLSREGLCGRPAVYLWLVPDGTQIRICERCFPSVAVNGCEIIPIKLSKPLPCPFCGGEAYCDCVDHDNWFCSCKKCDVYQEMDISKIDAIAAWNTRKTDNERDWELAYKECLKHLQYSGKQLTEEKTNNLELKELLEKTKIELSDSEEYADKLAKGLPCLPKDVEVLRKANLDFAKELYDALHTIKKEKIIVSKLHDNTKRLDAWFRSKINNASSLTSLQVSIDPKFKER
jgi:hypothetical protein